MESAGEGSGRPAALPHISPTFVLVIVSPLFSPPLFETTGCHAEVRGTEKRTRQSRQADKPAYERMMSKVRKKKKKKRGTGRKERGLVVLLQGEHTYPVRLNQSRRVEGGGRKGGVGWGGVGFGNRMGWAKGRKRQDEEGEKEARSDSDSQSSSKGQKLK